MTGGLISPNETKHHLKLSGKIHPINQSKLIDWLSSHPYLIIWINNLNKKNIEIIQSISFKYTKKSIK